MPRKVVLPSVVVVLAVMLALAGVAFLGLGQVRAPGPQPLSPLSSAAGSPAARSSPSASTPSPEPAATPGPGGLVPRPILLPVFITARPTMDFCGQVTIVRTARGDIGDTGPWTCLLAARDAGRPAELIQDGVTIEGSPLRQIVRVSSAGKIELIHDATRDAFGSGTWTRMLCDRIETYQPDPTVPAQYIPEDCAPPTTVAGAGGDEPSGAEMASLEALVRFARTGDGSFLDAVPLAPGGVWLGLGDQLVARLSPLELGDPTAWLLSADAFRGRVGPFSALDQLTAWGPDSPNPTMREAAVLVGSHDHCASAPIPAPSEVANLRRVSVQPIGVDGCLGWWTVDLFLSPDGSVAAITLDLSEP